MLKPRRHPLGDLQRPGHALTLQQPEDGEGVRGEVRLGLALLGVGQLPQQVFQVGQRLLGRLLAVLKRPGDLLGLVYDLIGGYLPLKEVERSFGYDADDPVVQGWIETLMAGEWAEEGGNNAPGP